jgi:GNAT superfamily N-acetyltransferase
MREIEIRELDGASLAALHASRKAFERSTGVRLGGARAALCDLARRTLTPPADRTHAPVWRLFLAIDPETGAAMGCCGIRCDPSVLHEVEIAYLTFPAFRGQGIATSMAGRLVEDGFASGAERVVAHTRAPHGRSARVLARLGFSSAGVHRDHDHGRAWRWVLGRRPRDPNGGSGAALHPVSPRPAGDRLSAATAPRARRLVGRRRVLVALFAGFVPFAALVTPLGRLTGFPSALLMGAYVVTYLAAALAVAFAHCPACGGRLFEPGGGPRPWPGDCPRCGARLA